LLEAKGTWIHVDVSVFFPVMECLRGRR